MTMALRTPVPSHYDVLASWIDDATACARWAGPLLKFPFPAGDLPALLGSDNTSSFSLVDSSCALVGFGQLVQKDPTVLRLARIIIAPQMRGLGLGKTLCELLLAQASTNAAVEQLTLGVYRDNPSAISLYMSLGFAEAPPHPRPELIAMQRRVVHG
jgi:[ribosomal protein S18]-alanine N-acetyltransferase